MHGDWYFPNGSIVTYASQGAVTFRTNRNDDGNVSLFRLSNSVSSPTGRFCCEIKNSTDHNQTLCINICELKNLTLPAIRLVLFPLCLVSVNIDDGGAAPIAGLSYTLTCRVNGVAVTAYQWEKNGQTHNERGQSLLLSPLTLSHAGQYTCAAIVDSRLYYSNITTVAIKS